MNDSKVRIGTVDIVWVGGVVSSNFDSGGDPDAASIAVGAGTGMGGDPEPSAIVVAYLSKMAWSCGCARLD